MKSRRCANSVEKALLVAEANISRRNVDLARKLEDDLKAAFGYHGLARTLAHGISKYLVWDYVAVFALRFLLGRLDILRARAKQFGRTDNALLPSHDMAEVRCRPQISHGRAGAIGLPLKSWVTMRPIAMA
jgi:hypothetical protein